MKTTQSSGTSPDHQAVAGEFEVKTGGKSITIGFTDQRLSPHAGSATFWSWLRRLDWRQTLTAALPQALPLSNIDDMPAMAQAPFVYNVLEEKSWPSLAQRIIQKHIG